MTPEEKRELKKQGKLIVEKRSAALHEAYRHATPNLEPLAFQTAKANEQWLIKNREHILAVEVSKRFVVTPADELGWHSAFVECLNCHDVLHTYPSESTQCGCGTLSVTFKKPRRGLPPMVSARDNKARTVVLIAKG